MKLEFNIERLHRLLKSFYQLTGIRIVILIFIIKKLLLFLLPIVPFVKKYKRKRKAMNVVCIPMK